MDLINWRKSDLKCKKEERLTGSSPRLFSPGFTHSIEEHEKSPILNKVEFFVSNLCNLDCVMCNPSFSSKWNALVPELNKSQINFGNFETTPTKSINPAAIDSVFEKVKTSQEVLLLGGEPFASKEVLFFIERWVNEKCPGPLTIISNGTLLNSDIIELLSRCQNLLLILSIDATGPLFEWIRGSRWSLVQKNIVEANKKIRRVTLSPTIAAYNILGIEEFCDFCTKYDLNYKLDHMLSQPTYLSMKILSLPMRSSIATRLESHKNERLERLITALRQDFDSPTKEHKDQFLRWCNFFSVKRGIDLFGLYPELKNLD